MSGVLLVRREAAISIALEELLIIAECIELEEWEGAVRYLRA